MAPKPSKKPVEVADEEKKSKEWVPAVTAEKTWAELNHLSLATPSTVAAIRRPAAGEDVLPFGSYVSRVLVESTPAGKEKGETGLSGTMKEKRKTAAAKPKPAKKPRIAPGETEKESTPPLITKEGVSTQASSPVNTGPVEEPVDEEGGIDLDAFLDESYDFSPNVAETARTSSAVMGTGTSLGATSSGKPASKPTEAEVAPRNEGGVETEAPVRTPSRETTVSEEAAEEDVVLAKMVSKDHWEMLAGLMGKSDEIAAVADQCQVVAGQIGVLMSLLPSEFIDYLKALAAMSKEWAEHPLLPADTAIMASSIGCRKRWRPRRRTREVAAKAAQEEAAKLQARVAELKQTEATCLGLEKEVATLKAEADKAKLSLDDLTKAKAHLEEEARKQERQYSELLQQSQEIEKKTEELCSDCISLLKTVKVQPLPPAGDVQAIAKKIPCLPEALKKAMDKAMLLGAREALFRTHLYYNYSLAALLEKDISKEEVEKVAVAQKEAAEEAQRIVDIVKTKK
ncbi:hypothetical protein ACQ4PT_020688 [Festuca glaucescens]